MREQSRTATGQQPKPLHQKATIPIMLAHLTLLAVIQTARHTTIYMIQIHQLSHYRAYHLLIRAMSHQAPRYLIGQ